MTTQRLLLSEPPDYSIPIAPEMRETFRVLDVVASGWIVVLSFTTTAPPSVPQQGDAYLVPGGATGAWTGHQNHLAIFTPVGWIFRAPRFGWIAVIVDQNPPYGKVLQYSGTEWTGWILPASQVSYSTVGTDFVSTTLQALMLEVNLRLIADETVLDDHETRIAAIEAAGGSGGSAKSPDTFPTSHDPTDDEFEFGTDFDTTGGRFSGAQSWTTTVYAGSTTRNVKQGSVAIFAGASTTGPSVWRLPIASPTSAWQYTAKIAVFSSTFGNFNHFGMHAYNASTTKWQTIHFLYSSGPNLEVAKWTAGTFNSATTYGDLYNGERSRQEWLYLQIEFDTTNLIFRWSPTGRDGSFKQFVSEAYTSHFGSGNRPDEIGLHLHPSGTANLVGFCDWFRKTA